MRQTRPRGRPPNRAINIERLRRALDEADRWDQTSLAAALGHPSSTVGRWLADESNPSPMDVSLMEDKLGKSEGYLYGFDDTSHAIPTLATIGDQQASAIPAAISGTWKFFYVYRDLLRPDQPPTIQEGMLFIRSSSKSVLLVTGEQVLRGSSWNDEDRLYLSLREELRPVVIVATPLITMSHTIFMGAGFRVKHPSEDRGGGAEVYFCFAEKVELQQLVEDCRGKRRAVYGPSLPLRKESLRQTLKKVSESVEISSVEEERILVAANSTDRNNPEDIEKRFPYLWAAVTNEDTMLESFRGAIPDKGGFGFEIFDFSWHVDWLNL